MKNDTQSPVTPPGSQGGMVRHDFTKDKCCWGWNFLNAYPRGDNQWDAMLVGSGIKDGHEIMLSTGDGVAVLVASHVEYEHNPPDLMKCRLTLMPNYQARPRGSKNNETI